ncbi:MAG: hypothetical protein WCB99_04065 [Candidatus Cybelea sp.]|jgi:hypothetical protein
MTQLIFQSNPWSLLTLMLVVLGLSIEVPYRFGPLLARYKLKTDPFNAVQAGLLSLSAFVLALSFNQTSARFDARRSLVTREAIAIGTTWLRANQLDPTASKRFRQILTDYTAARVRAYDGSSQSALFRETIDQSDKDQSELWAIASAALHTHQTNPGALPLLQSTSDMIAVSLEQLQARTSHLPTVVVVLTLVLVALGTLSLGFRFAFEESRPVILSAIYVVAYVLVISMMVDYDRPDTGFVRVGLTPMTQLLQWMQRPP